MELQLIQRKIYEIRGRRVMLDFDLADMYEVETKMNWSQIATGCPIGYKWEDE